MSAIWRDRFYVITNDGAPRYRVFKVDPRKPERAAWKEIVPQERVDARDAGHRRRAPRADVHAQRRDARSRCTISTASSCARSTCRRSARPGGIERQPRRGHRLLLVHVVHVAAGDLQDVDQDRQGDRVDAREAADRDHEADGRAGVLSVEGRHEDLDVHHPPQGREADGKHPTILYGYGGFNVPHDAGVRGVAHRLARARRRLRDPEPARRRRVRRGLAPRRHAAREAERVRRLHRRGRVLDQGRLDVDAITSRSPAARTAGCSSVRR